MWQTRQDFYNVESKKVFGFSRNSRFPNSLLNVWELACRNKDSFHKNRCSYHFQCHCFSYLYLNCPPSPIVPFYPMVLSIATLIQAANNDMKLHKSVRTSLKLTNLTHSIESSIPKVIPVRLASEPTSAQVTIIPEIWSVWSQDKLTMLPKGT